MTAYIITGLGYGDEGKGSVTDYLARQAPTVVVRHNGGPQAGHNVVTADGRHHCFSQFGAGTFAGAKTFLSRFMLINPLTMAPEGQHLHDMGVPAPLSHLYVDETARLITPFHVAINRLLEMKRPQRHGSCGQGVGVVMEQDLAVPQLTLRVKDIGCIDFPDRVEALRRHLEATYKRLEGANAHWSVIEDNDLPQHLVDRFREWVRAVNVVSSTHLATMVGEHEQVIFEGAQGVLLDEWWGFAPHTTWSTTTTENALTLWREATNSGQPPMRIGVLRTVTTRHGAGPLPTEDPELSATWKEFHNTAGPWQGPFRVGHLDLVSHRYAATVCGGLDQLAVTHLDCGGPVWRYARRYSNMDKIPLGRRGDLNHQEAITRSLAAAYPVCAETDEIGLLTAIETTLDTPITITSYGPTAADKHIRIPARTP